MLFDVHIFLRYWEEILPKSYKIKLKIIASNITLYILYLYRVPWLYLPPSLKYFNVVCSLPRCYNNTDLKALFMSFFTHNSNIILIFTLMSVSLLTI